MNMNTMSECKQMATTPSTSINQKSKYNQLSEGKIAKVITNKTNQSVKLPLSIWIKSPLTNISSVVWVILEYSPS